MKTVAGREADAAALGRATPWIGPLDLALILVFTLASMLAINPYSYGYGDNRITIPLLKAFVNPHLYPGDLMIAQRPFYYTYLWNTLGLLHSRLGISLPSLFLVTYLIALYCTFLGVYRIAMNLFGDCASATLSLILVVFSGMSLGAVSMIDPMLTTRAVAMPILLFAISAFLDRHTLRAFSLVGLAYLAHPLTTHFVLAMLVVACLTVRRSDGPRPLVTGLVTFLAIASPLLLWKLRHSPPSLHLFSADPRWIDALRYRSAHHMFPFSWGLVALLHGVVGVVLLRIAARRCDRPRGDRGAIVASAMWTIFGLCAAGIVFSELVPMGLAFIAMPLRSFLFLDLFAMIYVSRCFTAGTGALEPRAYGLIVALAAVWASYGIDDPVRVVAEVGVVAAFLAIGRSSWGESRRPKRIAFVTACLVSLGAGACLTYAKIAHGESGFAFDITGEPLWQDVQRWARQSTDIRAGFIIPPLEQVEFRVGSERTIYGDSEGGGLMNFNPEYGIEWLRRMRKLGAPEPGTVGFDYCALSMPQLRAIADEMAMPGRQVYLVWPCAGRPLEFPVRYRNGGFTVYEVPSEPPLP